MRCKRKFQSNYMSFQFLLDIWCRQSFTFWSKVHGTHCAHFCHQCSCKIILMEPVLMPTVSAISYTLTWRFCSTIFSIAQQFSSQLQMYVLTRSYLQGIFCLDKTSLNSTAQHWPWHARACILPFTSACICSITNYSIYKVVWLKLLPWTRKSLSFLR